MQFMNCLDFDFTINLTQLLFFKLLTLLKSLIRINHFFIIMTILWTVIMLVFHRGFDIYLAIFYCRYYPALIIKYPTTVYLSIIWLVTKTQCFSTILSLLSIFITHYWNSLELHFMTNNLLFTWLDKPQICLDYCVQNSYPF